MSLELKGMIDKINVSRPNFDDHGIFESISVKVSFALRLTSREFQEIEAMGTKDEIVLLAIESEQPGLPFGSEQIPSPKAGDSVMAEFSNDDRQDHEIGNDLDHVSTNPGQEEIDKKFSDQKDGKIKSIMGVEIENMEREKYLQEKKDVAEYNHNLAPGAKPKKGPAKPKKGKKKK